MRLRTGYTVGELLLVLVIMGTLMALIVPRVVLVIDRIAVRSAASDLSATFRAARTFALASRAPVADHLAPTGTLEVRRGAEILLTRNVGQAHGVRLAQTRDSMAFDGWGLGIGAANLSIVVRRRAAAETVFVSRLGRVR